MSIEARNRDLETWLPKVASGQVRLPRFQRYEAWGPVEIADLLQTVLDRLPAGAALILDVGDESPFVTRPLSGVDQPTDKLVELLLDGQQRLTALHRALHDRYDDRTFFVSLEDVDHDGDGQRDFAVSGQSRYLRDGIKFPLWCDDPVKCLERGVVPVRLLRPGQGGESELTTWLNSATAGNPERVLELYQVISELRSRVAKFNLPFLSLPVGTEEHVILSVFEKLNTRAVPLTAFDIVVARVEGETGESLHDLVGQLQRDVPEIERYTDHVGRFALSVVALLQDKLPNERGYAFVDLNRMLEEWSAVTLGVQRLVQQLQDEAIWDKERLPTAAVLAPLAAMWAQVSNQPDRLGAARTLLRRYLWTSFATERYERAAATNAYRDYLAIMPAILGDGPADPDVFDREKYPLPTVEELVGAGWPVRRDRLPRTILALSFQMGALDLADGASINESNVRLRHHHHLFPVKYLAGLEVSESDASRALNCALITAGTNLAISAKPPIDYIADRCAGAELGEAEIRSRLATHLIGYDALQGEYDAFLNARAEMVLASLTKLVSGEKVA
jgi:hypothetical protein